MLCSVLHINQRWNSSICITAPCYFLVMADLIGLLHLFLHPDSRSNKHNVTLFYSTHIWNHRSPSLVLSSELHGVFSTLFVLCDCLIVMQNLLRADACWLWLEPNLCRLFLICFSEKERGWVIATLLLPMTNRILWWQGKSSNNRELLFFAEGRRIFLVMCVYSPACDECWNSHLSATRY